MTKEQYFDMMDQIGAEPVEEEIPIEFEDFLQDTQDFISIYNLMPSRWDGFSGSYMGKDMSNLPTLFDIFHIKGNDLKLIALTVFSHLDDVNTERINQKIQEKQQRGKKGTTSRGNR